MQEILSFPCPDCKEPIVIKVSEKEPIVCQKCKADLTDDSVLQDYLSLLRGQIK